MSRTEEWEKELAKQLTEGELKGVDPSRHAVDRLSPKYEAVVRAEKDPIEAETERYRELAEEVDERYDRYGKDNAVNQKEEHQQ